MYSSSYRTFIGLPLDIHFNICRHADWINVTLTTLKYHEEEKFLSSCPEQVITDYISSLLNNLDKQFSQSSHLKRLIIIITFLRTWNEKVYDFLIDYEDSQLS